MPPAPPEKSDRAFRTISEAAETMGVAQHVLRFWETRFPQLQPLKRGGGRRYYRPSDMALLETIRAMLHDQGLTIRGAQLALASGRAGKDPDAKPLRSRKAGTAPATPAQPAVATGAEAPDTGEARVRQIPPPVDLSRLIAIRDRLKLALAA